MGTAPSYSSGFAPGVLAGQQGQQAQAMTPAAAALNAQFQQLPAYQAYIDLLNRAHTTAEQRQAASTLQAQGDALHIPDSMIFDPYTGVVRDKNWNERNSNWSALMYAGIAVGAGLTAGAAVGALAGAAPAVGADVGALTTVPELGAAGTAGLTPLAATTIAPALGTLPAVAPSGLAAVAPAIAPAVAPAAATTPSASSWLTNLTGGKGYANLITTGLNAFGNIYSANKQQETSEAAQQIQAQEFDKALAAAKEEQTYKRSAFSSYTDRLQPYANSGYAASDRLSQFMGQPPAARTGAATTPPAPATPPPTAAPTAAPPASTPATVMLQAPDGTTKEVSAADAPYYIARGAKAVAA